MRCGVGGRCSSDPTLQWLWPAATPLICLLAWKPPYAEVVALKRQKKKKKKNLLLYFHNDPMTYDLCLSSTSLFEEPSFKEGNEQKSPGSYRPSMSGGLQFKLNYFWL